MSLRPWEAPGACESSLSASMLGASFSLFWKLFQTDVSILDIYVMALW